MNLNDKIEYLMGQFHKVGVNRDDWYNVSVNLIDLAVFYVGFCVLYDINPCFTSIIREKIPGVSKTDIHAKKRAFDASAKGWTTDLMDNFLDDGNKKFLTIGALSNSDKISRAFLFHGEILHLHAQVRI